MSLFSSIYRDLKWNQIRATSFFEKTSVDRSGIRQYFYRELFAYAILDQLVGKRMRKELSAAQGQRSVLLLTAKSTISINCSSDKEYSSWSPVRKQWVQLRLHPLVTSTFISSRQRVLLCDMDYAAFWEASRVSLLSLEASTCVWVQLEVLKLV